MSSGATREHGHFLPRGKEKAFRGYSFPASERKACVFPILLMIQVFTRMGKQSWTICNNNRY